MSDIETSATHDEADGALSVEAQRALLMYARKAIQDHLSRGQLTASPPEAPELSEAHAVFVTLEVDGKLRGCMGQPDADGPLHEAAAHMAVTAATQDPNFSALELSDLRYTELEISVLSPHRTIDPDDIEIGTHGLYIAAGPKRAIILPQVAYDQGWSVKRYLEELTTRAGLKRRAWGDPKVSLRGFTAQVFRDTDLI